MDSLTRENQSKLDHLSEGENSSTKESSGNYSLRVSILILMNNQNQVNCKLKPFRFEFDADRLEGNNLSVNETDHAVVPVTDNSEMKSSDVFATALTKKRPKEDLMQWTFEKTIDFKLSINERNGLKNSAQDTSNSISLDVSIIMIIMAIDSSKVEIDR